MIQTQLLQLQPPYQVIYCGGELGLHIATLIVVDEQRDENGRYMGIRTYSHPVVSYTNKLSKSCAQTLDFDLFDEPGQEGVVWNRAELKDVVPFCLGTDEKVGLDRINSIRYELSIPGGCDEDFPSLFQLVTRLANLGIGIELPERQAMEEPQILEYNAPKRQRPAHVSAWTRAAVFYTPWASAEEMAHNLNLQRLHYQSLYPIDIRPHITFCIDKEMSFPGAYCAEEKESLDEQYMAIDPEIRERMERLVQLLNGD